MAWVLLGGFGCSDDESAFIQGRLENRCNGAIPVCGFQAACVLGADQFIRGRFPGGQRVIVRTQTDPTQIRTRFLLLDQKFPGSEIAVRAFDTGCGDFDEEQAVDRDLFDLAGDDGIIEYTLEVEGRGDHYVDVFSDMTSDFIFKVELED